MSGYGQIISAKQVERAVVASLSMWIDNYLGALEPLDGYQPNQIERPKDILTQSEFEKWPEVQIPFILVMCGGLAGPPERHADGAYNAQWRVGIAAVVSDVDQAATRDLALTYGAAVRAAILQHKMLKSPLHPNGFANYTTWHDETYSDVPFERTRTLGSARMIFDIGVEGVVTEFTGPTAPYVPASDPPPPDPVVQEVDITAQPRTILESVTS